MPHGDDVITPPAVVPSPRLPHSSEFAPFRQPDPGTGGPGLPPSPEPRGRSKLVLMGVLGLVAAVALGAGAAFVAHRESFDASAEAAGQPAAAAPLAPFEHVNATLKAQAAALLRDDEQAWLAAVDPRQPKLRSRYRTMFRSLRALGVSHFAYKTSIRNDSKIAAGSLGIRADVEYCFAGDSCVDSAGPPTTVQVLKLKLVKDQWLITSVNTQLADRGRQSPPWQNGELVSAQGKRATLVAMRGDRHELRRLLPIADEAAAITDRFAGLVGNPQHRYRIYLAGDKQWKTWYGGITDQWVVGYARPLNEADTDVVLNMAKLRDDERLMATTIRHELGHVVTLGGVRRRSPDRPSDMWLKEGIAEYIGWHPRPATASWRRQAVSDAVNGSRPLTTIAGESPGANALNEQGDAFYGLGHFAADCLATMYGERALFHFVRLHLRESRDLDPASQEAFGKPFAAVDRACVSWIRDRV
ncbi:hypothetical protein AB0M36_26740 [Actinoplanes sp. NPDC051346]|uniref:hypothetical protein n=1 Tax=Actinoplanes sp. NPDC051346 TaxID=3155048 RepID=UPI00341FAAC1